MVDIFKVYRNLKKQENLNAEETAFINTVDNIAKQYRISPNIDITTILENYNDSLMKLVISGKKPKFTLYTLLSKGFSKKEITPESIESFYTEYTNSFKTAECTKSMDHIVAFEAKSLSQEKFELKEEEFISRLDSTLSKLKEIKIKFMESIDIRSKESREAILAKLDQKVSSSYMKYCDKMMEEFPESAKIIEKINNFIGSEEHRQTLTKMNKESKTNSYISPIKVFTQSSEYLKSKEEEKKAFALANSPTGRLLYNHKEKDKVRIKKSNDLITSYTNRQIEEISISKDKPEELLKRFINGINAYNRQELSDEIRNACQRYSESLIQKHPEIQDSTNEIREYINSDTFKTSIDRDIIKSSKEYSKNQKLLKGNIKTANEELEKAVISLSPPPLLSRPNAKFDKVIPKGNAAVIDNLKILVDRLKEKKESILAKVSTEHQENMSTELDKKIESLYESRKNELATEAGNKAIIESIDKFTSSEKNISKNKHEVIKEFKEQYGSKQRDANERQLEMAKIAKQKVIEELKEYIINKNAKKKPPQKVNNMIQSYNELLNKEHKIQLSDIEEEAKKLATEEIRKKRSRFTGIIQHIAGTSSASKVEEIVSNLKGVMQHSNLTTTRRPPSIKGRTQNTRH
ncbi:MAG: hypothetical protein N4A31_05000 [Rickettsiales bacterium]|jgi:hypothetical protein|nr:hypothetical protein [Rickettsiales bacterium]